MLSTAGLVPVAQEFCKAGTPRFCGSEFSPVSAECPSTMMPRSGCDAEVVPLDGLAGAVLVEVAPGSELDPHETAASKARPTAEEVAQNMRIRPPAGRYRARRVRGWRTTLAHQSLTAAITLGHVQHRVILAAGRLLIAVSLLGWAGISGPTLRSAARPRHGAHPGPGRGLALRFTRRFQG